MCVYIFIYTIYMFLCVGYILHMIFALWLTTCVFIYTYISYSYVDLYLYAYTWIKLPIKFMNWKGLPAIQGSV